jgi:hypothetical protein
MSPHLQTVAIVSSAILLIAVVELVRRKRFLERYALVWLGAAIALLALAVWTGLLEKVSRALGVQYPSNALFVIAFGFVLLLLLHFSVAVSRLADQARVLAQRLALLDAEVRRLRARDEEAAEDEQDAGEPRRMGVGEDR